MESVVNIGIYYQHNLRTSIRPSHQDSQRKTQEKKWQEQCKDNRPLNSPIFGLPLASSWMKQ